MDGTVLVADDDRTIRTVLTQALTRAGCRVHATGSLVTLMSWVEEGRGDVVISDVVMPDGNGLEALPRIHALRPDLPVIVISAQNTIMTAIQANERAAFDYLPKPFDLPDLMKRTAQALDRRRVRAPQTLDAPVADPTAELPLVGHSAPMQALYRLIARVLHVDLSVLITGESGTGKSLIARVLHDQSDRRDAPFVILRPDDLAGEQQGDLTRRAAGGTILCDSVGDLDALGQARLAQLLDSLGVHAPRVLATGPADLATRAALGRFREDLYYRLAGVTLAVPSLRDRVEDIADLAAHFLSKAALAGLPARHFSDAALDRLRSASWPGNLRELENLVTRLAVTSADAKITPDEITAALAPPEITPVQPSELRDERLSDAVARHIQRYFDLHGAELPPSGLYPRILREMEQPLIEIALDATGGNQAKCADLLGINRNTLRKKLTDLGIEVTRRRKLM